MKYQFFVISALLLASCQSVTPPAADQVAIAKAEYSAEVAYSAASQVYVAAEASLPAATKAQAKGVLLQILNCSTPTTCTGYLQLARNAAAISDSASLATQVTEVIQLAGQVQTIVKPAK